MFLHRVEAVRLLEWLSASPQCERERGSIDDIEQITALSSLCSKGLLDREQATALSVESQ